MLLAWAHLSARIAGSESKPSLLGKENREKPRTRRAKFRCVGVARMAITYALGVRNQVNRPLCSKAVSRRRKGNNERSSSSSINSAAYEFVRGLICVEKSTSRALCGHGSGTCWSRPAVIRSWRTCSTVENCRAWRRGDGRLPCQRCALDHLGSPCARLHVQRELLILFLAELKQEPVGAADRDEAEERSLQGLLHRHCFSVAGNDLVAHHA